MAEIESEVLLRIDGVSAGYNGGTVLHDVSLEVRRGDVLAIVGHNGAGKTTLLDTVAGLIRVAEGTVELDGTDITRLPIHRRARLGIGYVPQGRRVFKSVTVAEHLSIAGGRRRTIGKWTKATILDMLPRLGERLRHKGHQLSGGEQQMLALARALLTEPRLLLLDEPTEGLAPAIVEQLHKVIATLAADGMTIVLAAPQPDWPLRIADQISVLSTGRQASVFTASQLKQDSSVLLDALSIAPTASIDRRS